jgi:hypothetical protein
MMQKFVSSGFYGMFILGSLPSMAFAEEEVPEAKPWGIITNAKGVPVNKPFVFDEFV